MTKRVYLEPLWKMRSIAQELVAYPPQGYEFVTLESPQGRIIQAASRMNFSYRLLHGTSMIVPVSLAKPYLERFRKTPENIDLTYAVEHLVFRKEPWVVDTEYVSLLAGYNVKHFKRYRKVVQTALASPYCKKIICWYEAARRTVLLNLDCTEFEQKLEVVPLAVHKKEFTKNFANRHVKLLFVGSANIPGQFEIKGGTKALEAFILLKKKYDNLELVIRSDVPKDVKRKYIGVRNLKIIDGVVPWQQVEHEFKSADIFLLPAHNTPFMAFLDAMSYELPVVTIDAWANSEIVENGKTGFVVKKSEKIPCYVENLIPNFGSPEFEKAIRTPDPQAVQELVEKIGILIENKDLRRRMGKAARWEVEQGEFSIAKRNEKLKRVFDEATA